MKTNAQSVKCLYVHTNCASKLVALKCMPYFYFYSYVTLVLYVVHIYITGCRTYCHLQIPQPCFTCVVRTCIFVHPVLISVWLHPAKTYEFNVHNTLARVMCMMFLVVLCHNIMGSSSFQWFICCPFNLKDPSFLGFILIQFVWFTFANNWCIMYQWVCIINFH